MKLVERIRQGNSRKARPIRLPLWLTAVLAVLMTCSAWPGESVRQKGQHGCTMILVGNAGHCGRIRAHVLQQ